MVKNIAISVLSLITLLLIIFRTQVNVSMKQNQTQSMETDIWNVANNQNINLNVLNTFSTGKVLHYSNAVFSKIVNIQGFYSTLSSFQKMYTHTFYLEGKALIYYPVLVDESKIERVSFTNFNTNYNSNSNTNLLWVDWR